MSGHIHNYNGVRTVALVVLVMLAAITRCSVPSVRTSTHQPATGEPSTVTQTVALQERKQ